MPGAACRRPLRAEFKEGGFVAGVPKWGRSSKRRLRLIRWTPWELVSLGLMSSLISLLCLVLAEWLARHPFD
jgi:hypothetical protein